MHDSAHVKIATIQAHSEQTLLQTCIVVRTWHCIQNEILIDRFLRLEFVASISSSSTAIGFEIQNMKWPHQHYIKTRACGLSAIMLLYFLVKKD